MITNLISILCIGFPAAEPLRQVIFAFDRPEPKLEATLFASDKREDLEKLASKEALTVRIEKGVAYVCRKNILNIEDAKVRTGLMKQFATMLSEPYKTADLNQLPAAEQEHIRRMIASEAGPDAAILLKAERALFHIEPEALVRLRKGEKTATAFVSPLVRPKMDELRATAIDPEAKAKTKYPMEIEPEKLQSRKKPILGFQFASQDEPIEQRLEHIRKFTMATEAWIEEATAEFNQAREALLPALQAAHPDLYPKEGVERLDDLPQKMRTRIERQITGAFMDFVSSGEAAAFLPGARIESIEHVPVIKFRINNGYQESAENRSRSLFLSEPTLRLVNPIGK